MASQQFDLRAVGSRRSRRTGGRVTDPDRFSALWPSLVPRLSGMLRRRGVGNGEIEDVIQETALRVLRAGPEFETADDLWPWVATVAGRLWIDRTRTARDTESMELFDAADTVD